MATLPELARMHTRLDGDELAHLTRLVATWGMLADLCFADLLLFVPVAGDDPSRFIVLGQMRPTTSQTLHRDDLVGRIIDEAERPLVARAWRTGEIMDGELTMQSRGEQARMQCIPVRFHGTVVAVLTRESPIQVGRRPGELERSYLDVFERFARMLTAGSFPYPIDEGITAESPRVGDGVLLLDEAGRVVYGSPNAINALHRMGVYSNAEGATMEELGVEQTAVVAAWDIGLPVTEEVERRPDVIVLLRCLPLVDQARVTGGIVLLRDVTDLRRRDRELLSKDATIREVHHRVKNNLQTIGSLLRLQGRRLPPGEGRQALEEAERRIRSIALVHEILSRDASEQVPFNDIVQPLVRMAEDALISPDTPIEFRVAGDAGELPASLATPLAVVLTELLQNAVEHAFPEGSARPGGPDGVGYVDITFDNDGDRLLVTVRDNGRGLPAGFTIGGTRSLGLSIARNLVEQMGGTFSMRSDKGTIATLDLPVPTEEDPKV